MIRCYNLKVRLTDLERRRLEHAARKMETTITDLIRTAALKVADRYPLPATAGELPPLRKNASIDARIERSRERQRLAEAERMRTAQPQPVQDAPRKPPMSNRGTPEQRAAREAKRLKEEADRLEMQRILREPVIVRAATLPITDAYGVTTYPDGSTYNAYTGLWTEPADEQAQPTQLDPWSFAAADPEDLEPAQELRTPATLNPLAIVSPNPTYAEEPQTECFYCDSPDIVLMGQTVNGSDWYTCRSCNRTF